MAQVVIMMGSKSDEEKVSPCVDVLRLLGISYLFTVSSAHRTPERTEKILLRILPVLKATEAEFERFK